MKVQCSKCESKYNIKDEKIPDAGAKIKCPKCQNLIHVMKIQPKTPVISAADIEQIPDPKNQVSKKKSKDMLGILFLTIPIIASLLILLLDAISIYNYQTYILITFTTFASVLITATLAASEANKLNFGKNPSGKKESGPVGIFFCFVLLWVVSYPYYLYQRAKKGQKNRLVGGIVVALLFAASTIIATNPFESILNPEISMVKNGTLSRYPQKTVGEAVDTFMGNPKWEAINGHDGNTYVNVTGSILVMDESATAALQFKLDQQNGTFEINALEINGTPQHDLIALKLITAMYSNSNPYASPLSWNPIKLVLLRHKNLEEGAKQRAIDAALSELNGRESLLWADISISDSKYSNDAKLFALLEYNFGDDYVWVEGPNEGGGKLRFKDATVALQRTPSTIKTPAKWSRL